MQWASGLQQRSEEMEAHLERERSNLCENERANVIFSWVFLRRRNLENGFRLDRVGFSSAAAWQVGIAMQDFFF